MSSLLAVRDLATHFFTRAGVVKAVDGVSFDLNPGEVLGLVGESGSGKTLTCRSVLGVLAPGCAVSAGRVTLAGVELTALSEREWRAVRGRGIGAVFHDPASYLNPSLTVGRQLAEALRTNAGLDRRAAAGEAVRLLAAMGLHRPGDVFHQYPHELSGGMLQRVMIATALLTKPRLLLADEPTTALDVTTQAEVMAILDELRREFGLAMLFITHDLELAAAICDRTAVMYSGQIVEIRSSALLHDDPLHPYTAALAGARPDIAQTAHRLRAIPGRPLSAFEAPQDECAFAPRCPYARGRCHEEEPPLVEAEMPGHEYACWYPVGSAEYVEIASRRSEAEATDATSVAAGM